MSQNPTLHVLIPDLLKPLPSWGKDFGFEATSNSLSSLLVDHKYQNVPFKGLEGSVFSLLGFPLDTELPVAFFRAKKEGLNASLAQYQGTLLCADPIHLNVGTSEVIMDASSPVDDLTEEEADSLIALLNSYFEQDGLQFIKGAHNRWYLLMGEDDSIKTVPLQSLRGNDISKHLAHSDKTNLHQVQNEVQMLLHNADVNQRREQQGQQAVNSVWLWGGGTQTVARTRVRSVIEGGVLGEIASIAAQCHYQRRAADPEQVLNQLLAGGHHLLMLDQLTSYALNDDIQGWQQQFDKLEQQWFRPIETLVNKGKLDILLHDCNGKLFIPKTPSQLAQLLHKIKPKTTSLKDLANA